MNNQKRYATEATRLANTNNKKGKQMKKMQIAIKAAPSVKVSKNQRYNPFNAVHFKDGRMTIVTDDLTSIHIDAPEALLNFNGLLDLEKCRKAISKFYDIKSSDKNSVTFTDGDSDLIVQKIKEDEEASYPDDEYAPLDTQAEMPLKDLVAAITYCKQSVSHEIERLYLNYYCIKEGAMITTDGRRLSNHGIRIRNESNIDKRFMISIRAADFILKMAECYGPKTVAAIGQDETHTVIKIDDLTINMPAYDGTFPNWKQVVPKQTSQSFTVSQLDIKRILKSLQKSTAMKHGELGTSIIFSGITEQSSQVIFATDNMDFVNEWGELEIKTDAIIHHIESEVICLNGIFLKDALANTTGDVTFAFTSELQPIVLTDSNNKKAFVIIMPMKRRAACKEEPAEDEQIAI